jgi:hypothetical protein
MLVRNAIWLREILSLDSFTTTIIIIIIVPSIQIVGTRLQYDLLRRGEKRGLSLGFFSPYVNIFETHYLHIIEIGESHKAKKKECERWVRN